MRNRAGSPRFLSYMKNLQFQLTLDIDLEVQDAQDEKDVRRRIITAIENHFYENLLHNDDTGSLKIRATDPINKSLQTQAERVTPFANISAYFSSDGPAFVANIHHVSTNYLNDSDNDILTLTLSDINAALREAHHKYLVKLHEDRGSST